MSGSDVTATCITHPLEAVAALYAASGSQKAGDWGVRAAFEAALADPAKLAEVHRVDHVSV